ncbi:FUSC family protein [Micromonospora sp. WMMA1363]|uniref:FUSC family protein n=1 Tax=Micromonospora sp. WMMA1363 TaxID=3053985 RepID=UPI00259D3105|nr:FUSC family protein [Micromonospora sp. WMMA1363]MDM4718729.1 FUSC family protein [Micromonospora sp. WMMA1363]
MWSRRGVLDRLHQRDPDYRLTRRATRLTLVGCLAFYGCRYGLGNPIMATYALLGVVATGVFAPLPGRPAQRTRTLLAALPVVWMLVAAGTVLAANPWAAAAGMFVVGFTVAFAGVGGPRLIGLAGAFQLFYILACFPPYQPDTLPARLAGVTLAVGLVGVAQVTLWPGPAPVTFAQRLAGAARGVAAFVAALADVLAGQPGADEEARRRHARADDAVEQTQMWRLPPTERATSASRRDRALRDATTGLHQTVRIAEALLPNGAATTDVDAAALLRSCAASLRRSADALSGTEPASPDAAVAPWGTEPAPPDSAVTTRRRRPDAWRSATASHLRVDTITQTLAQHTDFVASAVRVAGGRRRAVLNNHADRLDTTQPPAGPDVFWYVRRSVPSLYWQRLRTHLTPRSVYFQWALRLAVALAAARLIADTLDLMHGFWVLLAVLTLLRTSAADTSATFGLALTGTVVGAAAGALLLLASPRPETYAVILPLTLLLALGVGPLLGLVWGQALLTLLLIAVFAQLTPTDWQLAGVRLLDVLIGAAVGVVSGILMWPRGGGGELCRRMAAYLDAGAHAIEETVTTLAGRNGGRHAVEAAHRAQALTDASFCQYHSERHDPRLAEVNWEAILAAGHRIVRGAEEFLAGDRARTLTPWWPEPTARLVRRAERLRSAYTDVASHLPQGRFRPVAPDSTATTGVVEQVHQIIQGGERRADVLCLVAVDFWLADLARCLTRVPAPARRAVRTTDDPPSPGP